MAAKEAKAPKAPKAGKARKSQGDGLLALWTIVYGVIFGGLWWLGWLALERAPGEDALHVTLPYSLTAGLIFMLLMLNISDALARGAQQGR